MPPYGTSIEADFDPTIHLELEPEKDPNRDDDEEFLESEVEEDDDRISLDS